MAARRRGLPVMCEPPNDLARWRGTFGLSGDGEALIFCEDALYVIPIVGVKGFEVLRTLPAKGGGSCLLACCEAGYAACPTKDVQVARGKRADDLDDIATKLAAAAGKPLKVGEYRYDV